MRIKFMPYRTCCIVVLMAFAILGGAVPERGALAAKRSSKVVITNSDISRALSQTSSYKVYDRPIIVQRIFNHQRKPAIMLMPENVSRATEEWRIQVTLQGGQPSVTASDNVPRIVPKEDADHVALHKAFLSACKYLESRNFLYLPVIIQVDRTEDGYTVSLLRLPRSSGPVSFVLLNHDFTIRHYRGGF